MFWLNVCFLRFIFQFQFPEVLLQKSIYFKILINVVKPLVSFHRFPKVLDGILSLKMLWNIFIWKFISYCISWIAKWQNSSKFLPILTFSWTPFPVLDFLFIKGCWKCWPEINWRRDNLISIVTKESQGPLLLFHKNITPLSSPVICHHSFVISSDPISSLSFSFHFPQITYSEE